MLTSATFRNKMSAAVVLLGMLWASDSNAQTARGTAIVAMGAEIITLDGSIANDAVTRTVYNHIYDTLVYRDRETKLQPGLALSWRLLNDTTWQFKLRQGVKFHNGEPFDAQAVKFSIDRVFDPAIKSTQLSYYKNVAGADVVDQYTVNIRTRLPDPTLPELMSLFPVIPPKYVAEKGTAYIAKHPVGTGPYKLVEWVQDDHLTLQSDPTYWKGAPKIQTVIFKPIPETATRIAALQVGSVDVITSVPPDSVGALKSAGIRVEGVPSIRTMFISLETTSPPFNDRRVRQALNYAVNVDEIIKFVLNGAGYRLATMLSSLYYGYNPDIKPYPYDPERAKKLLAEAGYPNGFSTSLNTPTGRYVKDVEVAQAIAGYLEKVGVKVNVVPLEWGVYLGRLNTVKLGPTFLLGHGMPVLDTRTGMQFELHSSGAGFNKDPELDKMLSEAGATMSPELRLQRYQKVWQYIKDEAPMIFLYQQQDIYGISARLNWMPRLDETILMYEASLKE